MKKVLRVGGYARVSHEEQKKFGYSIAAQTERIADWCEKNNHQLVKLYTDEGFTAGNMKRPQLQEMLGDLHNLDIIVFTRLDRLSRNVFEANKMLALFLKNDVELKSIDENDIDTTDADGLFNFQLRVSLAERELAKGSERIRAVFDYKIKNGQPITGKVPRGYKIAEVEGVKRLVKNEEESAWVAEVFEHFFIHQSIRATMQFLNEKHGFSYGYQVYNRILKNEIYYGTYSGNPNFCEPYITKADFEKAQELIARNIRVRNANHVFLFTGMLTCKECGRTLVGASRYDSRYNRRYFYYRCAHRYIAHRCNNDRYIKEAVVEEHLRENVNRLVADYVAEIKNVKSTAGDRKTIKAAKDIKAEMDNLNYIFMKKRITATEYDRLYEKLESDLKSLMDSAPAPRDVKALEAFLSSGWESLYDKMSRENRRALWRSVIKSIDAEPDKINEVEFI